MWTSWLRKQKTWRVAIDYPVVFSFQLCYTFITFWGDLIPLLLAVSDGPETAFSGLKKKKKKTVSCQVFPLPSYKQNFSPRNWL